VFTPRYEREVSTHTSRLIFRFPLPVSFDRCPIFMSLYMLRFPEVQMGEAWELSKKAVLFRISGSDGWKSAFPFFLEVTFGNETHLFLQNKVPPLPAIIVQFTQRTPTSGVHRPCRMPFKFAFVTELCTQ
jgi:hypothetical protein